MHCLAGTFLQTIPNETAPNGEKMYPLKIVLPPNLSRILYFDNQQQQQEWSAKLVKVMEYKNIFDFYNFKDSLGKGNFGVVNLAVHKKTGKHVAIKLVKKANMKPIEII